MRAKFINEGTTNFWPGYSDDSVAGRLSEIREKTSIIQNKELEAKEERIISFRIDIDNVYEKIIQKWVYANMVMTSLQDGFYIKVKLLDRAIELYQEILADPDLEKEENSHKHPGYFRDSIELILSKLSEIIKYPKDNDTVYAPGFLSDTDKERILVDKKHDLDYSK